MEQVRRSSGRWKGALWGSLPRALISAGLLTAVVAGLFYGWQLFDRERRVHADVFEFCRAAVDTADLKHPRYSGPPVPEPALAALNRRRERDGQAALNRDNLVLRCMDGAVHACDRSAGTSRCIKPDASGVPSAAIQRFCLQHPNTDSVPDTERTNAVWMCVGGSAMITRTEPVDRNGYFRSAWQRIDP